MAGINIMKPQIEEVTARGAAIVAALGQGIIHKIPEFEYEKVIEC